MNMPRMLFLFVLCYLLGLFVFGCTNLDPQPPTETNKHPTASQTQHVMPTLPGTPSQNPTMAPEDAMEFVLELMENNGGCHLPCWWGQIVPGVTRWEDAKSFLETFASDIRLAGQVDDYLLYGAYFTVPKNVRYFEKLEVSIDVKN